MQVSSSSQDYLETLFQLETLGKKLTVTAVADSLNRTKGTVVTAIKKLCDQGLVTHEAYGEIGLTDKGRTIGWQIYMKHERLTGFFRDLLGIMPDKAEEIACLIEHHLEGGAETLFFNLVSFLNVAREQNEPFMEKLSKELISPAILPMPLTLYKHEQGTVCRGAKVGAKISEITENSCYIDGEKIDLTSTKKAEIWVKP